MSNASQSVEVLFTREFSQKKKPCKCAAVAFPHRPNSVKGCVRDSDGIVVPCDCLAEVDPFATGDSWYKEKYCQNPENCACDYQ